MMAEYPNTQQLLMELYIKKIQNAKIPETDEWSTGLNTGLEWSIRILKGDKSAA
jgi:hypothetical protein